MPSPGILRCWVGFAPILSGLIQDKSGDTQKQKDKICRQSNENYPLAPDTKVFRTEDKF